MPNIHGRNQWQEGLVPGPILHSLNSPTPLALATGLILPSAGSTPSFSVRVHHILQYTFVCPSCITACHESPATQPTHPSYLCPFQRFSVSNLSFKTPNSSVYFVLGQSWEIPCLKSVLALVLEVTLIRTSFKRFHVLKAINILCRTCFSLSHRCLCAKFSFSFNSRSFMSLNFFYWPTYYIIQYYQNYKSDIPNHVRFRVVLCFQLISNFFSDFTYLMGMAISHACVYLLHTYAQCPLRSKQDNSSLELESQVLIRHHVGTENQTLALCKRNKWF
jgi:hypothetical protein